jgi:transposase
MTPDGVGHPKEFVLDGAGWHKAKALNIPDNIIPSKLPPYSPKLNPAEHIWEEIREKWFENKVFLSMDAVVGTLEVALYTLEDEKERVQNLVGFDWIVSAILNAT